MDNIGLDKLGRAILQKAVGRLQENDNLPHDAETVVEALENICKDEKKLAALIMLVEFFAPSFNRNLEGGYGAEVWIDEFGRHFIKNDVTMTNFLLNRENEMQAMKGLGGTVAIAPHGRFRDVNQLSEEDF